MVVASKEVLHRIFYPGDAIAETAVSILSQRLWYILTNAGRAPALTADACGFSRRWKYAPDLPPFAFPARPRPLANLSLISQWVRNRRRHCGFSVMIAGHDRRC